MLLDTEHSGVGIETIKMQIAASRGLGIVPMVRASSRPADRTAVVEVKDCRYRRRSVITPCDPINVVRDPSSNKRIQTGAWNTILSPAEAAALPYSEDL